jgi:serine/threonine-protein kinase
VFASGTVIAGKYRVEHTLGQGGMGTVLCATHLLLGTRIALKILHPEMARDRNIFERFLREGRASAQLRSEHVCKVSDVGTVDELPYLVMELLEGRDLGTMVKTHGPMPPVMVCEYVLQACCGLAEAHAAGIVHRDLKPGNLFLTRRPDGSALVKVLDFGVAKAPDSGDFSLTRTSSVMGSPGYMSPEQLRSTKDVDARSDIWSLGVVMFELMAGHQPFLAQSITELALRVAMDPTPTLTQVPPAFVEIVERCLEKDPARRYQDVAALAGALAALVGPTGHELAAMTARVLRVSHAAIPPPPAISPSAPTTLRGATGSITGRPATRSWKLPAVIGLGVATGIIGVIVATSGGSDDSTHVMAPAASAPAAPAAGGATGYGLRATGEPASTAPAAPAPPDAAAPPAPEQAKIEPEKAAPKPEARSPKPEASGAAPATKSRPKARPPEDVGESRY